MSWVAVAVGISAVAAGVTAYGSVKSAEDQSDAMNQDAKLKELQAQEVEREQSARTTEEGINNQKTLGEFRAGLSESGDAIAGSSLLALESMYGDMQRQQAEEQKESDYKAMMIRAGASVESQQASGVLTSGYINAGAGLVKSAGTILSLTGSSTKTSSGPTTPTGASAAGGTMYSLLN